MTTKDNLKSKLNISVFFIPALLFISVALLRLYPFQNTLFQDGFLNGKPIDDWGWYVKYALEIANDDVVHINQPTGWLYGQFLALSFLIFGETNIAVFLIQSIFLGISISFVYATFHDKMGFKKTKILLLILLIVFGFLDIFKYYTFRCLSENLLLLLGLMFLFYFIKGLENKKTFWQFISACILGFSCLTRPNIFPFAIIAIGLYSFYASSKLKIFLFTSIFILTILIQPFCNLFLIGSFEFFPLENLSNSHGGYFYTALNINKSSRNLLSLLGFMFFTSPDFQWRPHWTIMWILFLIFITKKIRHKSEFKMWEIVSLAFISCYYFVIVLIGDPDNGNYGFRLYFPGILVVLPFAILSIEKK